MKLYKISVVDKPIEEQKAIHQNRQDQKAGSAQTKYAPTGTYEMDLADSVVFKYAYDLLLLNPVFSETSYERFVGDMATIGLYAMLKDTLPPEMLKALKDSLSN